MAKYLQILLASFALCYAQTCYYPNGIEAEGDSPCDPGNEHSACCGQSLGSACLSNKLCRAPNGNVVRGSCTDRDWASPDCPQYCLGADTGGTDLISCSNVTDTDTSYCCDHSEDCCDTGVGRFQVEPPRPDVWAAWNRAKDEYVVIGTMYDSSTTTTSLTSTTTTSLTSPTTQPPRPTDSNLPRQDGEEDVEGGLSLGAKVGIGVGAGVGVVLVAALVFFLWRRRRVPDQLEPRSEQQPETRQVYDKGPVYIPEYTELQGDQGRGPVELSAGRHM